MNSLKKCVVAISLIMMIAATTFADCPNPGEMSGPPCGSTQMTTDDPSFQATTVPTISSEVEIITIDAVITALEDLLTGY